MRFISCFCSRRKREADGFIRGIISDDSDDDDFEIQYESVTSEDGGRDSVSISGGCDTNPNSDRIVIKLRKK